MAPLRAFLPLRLTLLAAPGLLVAACGGTSAADPPKAEPEPDLAAAFDQGRAWELLERQVALGPRPSGTPKLEALVTILEAELKSYGLTPVRESFVEPNTPIGPLTFTNLYADLEAPAVEGQPAPMVILASHFDTKRMEFEFLGANDGASSTAVLLELARVLKDRRAPVTYRFLFLDGEEAIRPKWVDPDNRYGSRYHVAQLKKNRQLKRIKALVLLDLVGDKDLRLTTDRNSDPDLLRLFFDAARANGMGKHVAGAPNWILDDHLSFRSEGVAVVDLIDLDFGPGNSYWHSPEDKPENCSPDSLGVIGRIVLHGIPELEAFALR